MEDISHSELVRMHQEHVAQADAMQAAQFRTQEQLTELTIQVAKIATTQSVHAETLQRHETWQSWGLRFVIGLVVVVIGYLIANPEVLGG